ncbi:hypothetical protein BHE74_00016477 [Ensete ventricosum]|nr:hypothetical protein GW17_00017250 [Ensete ventricosum]RWW75498.1 hypothetical protein BHE74_00016477 [Ensete ventricosum]RZR96012.1 hypothetical protein BHM03_00024938 [Ensete ventricosum]
MTKCNHVSVDYETHHSTKAVNKPKFRGAGRKGLVAVGGTKPVPVCTPHTGLESLVYPGLHAGRLLDRAVLKILVLVHLTQHQDVFPSSSTVKLICVKNRRLFGLCSTAGFS